MASTRAADGTEIAYEVIGYTTGAPVVLVHGIAESATTWKPIVNRLASRYRVVTLDLRGHGASGTSDRYDLAALATDVAVVVNDLGLDRPHLVGHSLGGVVVSAAGATLPVASVVSVDQSLQLDAFKEQLMAFEPQLRDPAAFPLVINALFEMMSGEMISSSEKARIAAARRPDQDVVLGVWDVILTSSTDEIASVVDGVLAGYSSRAEAARTPHPAYLALFGIDPGASYGDWIASHITGAVTEVWPDHGHYPHLVDPDRFVARLERFWN
jgi:pimeloyl-ACP methyl ester carboxylesterase